ncbi:MAG: hypothetical protein KDA85_03855 [Planctomycetaceae bacterium]|nr:hypothetical protein [Planctomycetaceae bacterium]
MAFDQLLARAREGDPGAIDVLMSDYETDVRMVARVRLGRNLQPYLDDIDLVQSVHRTVLEGIRNGAFAVSSRDNLIRLALTILRRKIAHKWRKLQHERRLSQVQNSPHSSAMPSDVVSAERDVSETMIQSQEARRILAVVDEDDRRFLLLKMQGLTTAEAAQRLNVNPVTLRSRLSRLRHRLVEYGMPPDSVR